MRREWQNKIFYVVSLPIPLECSIFNIKQIYMGQIVGTIMNSLRVAQL